MYINLYPQKQLKNTKRSFLTSGLFLLCGGTYSLVRELQQDQSRINWAIAASVICLVGAICLAVATDRFRLKDPFFSMDPERICYRLGLYGNQSVLYWREVLNVRVTEQLVLFELQDGQKKILSLSAIHAPEIARHVATSLRLAAMEKNIAINGVRMHPEIAAVAS